MKYKEVKSHFEELADAEKAKEMSAYMRNHFVFYGIPTPARRACYKDLLKSEKKKKVIDWDFLDACWNDQHRECQYLVRDYLTAMKAFVTFDDIPKIEGYVRSKQWWDSIDGLDKVIGHIGLTDKRVDDLMLTWAADDDFWVRRLAIDHQLGRKEKTNTELLEKILVMNFGSDEFFINKAIGWSLRDYSKTNPDWVRSFFQKYDSQMAPLSIREGSKYI
ncbi:3-methyladenine DNA glycosylase AlkD [Streptococcus henryi]|uniref:3-methyladenine DNA glycosylase AlkD n=2 Tax=Streptococcus henryi TaxID=439219 RepID=A0A1G6CVD6_9STRE|nr:3-methyladenine DNA glycosylase AlkD [Streptococcus henryi]